MTDSELLEWLCDIMLWCADTQFSVSLTDDWLLSQHVLRCGQAENLRIKCQCFDFQKNNSCLLQKSLCMNYRADSRASHDIKKKMWLMFSESMLQYSVAVSMNRTFYDMIEKTEMTNSTLNSVRVLSENYDYLYS